MTRPLRYDERPGKLSAAVGGGVWKGYAAGSMGLGYTSRDQNVRANVSATTTGFCRTFGPWPA